MFQKIATVFLKIATMTLKIECRKADTIKGSLFDSIDNSIFKFLFSNSSYSLQTS